MASTVNSAPSVRTVTIVPDHDFVIELKVLGERTHDGEQTKRRVKAIIRYEVKQKIIQDIPPVIKPDNETFFKARNSPNWRFAHGSHGDEISQIEIEEEFGSEIALEIILRIFHKTINDSCYEIDDEQFWYIAGVCHYLGIDAVPTRPFFADWYRRHASDDIDYQDAQRLLFPLWYFDHADGFKQITKFLVYNGTSHIDYRNPTKIKASVPRLIMQQLNSARGRLKTIFGRALWNPCAALLESTCDCAPQTYFDFSKSLVKVKVWPLEDTFKDTSMSFICYRVKDYKFAPTAKGCLRCRRDYSAIVAGAARMTMNAFHGMCLSCIEFSTERRFDQSDEEDEEIAQRFADGEFDKDCRVSHGQMSWWFSYNAQPEFKQKITKRIVDRR